MPSQVMRSIVKQIIKLHEALSAIFPASQVEVIVFNWSRESQDMFSVICTIAMIF